MCVIYNGLVLVKFVDEKKKGNAKGQWQGLQQILCRHYVNLQISTPNSK